MRDRWQAGYPINVEVTDQYNRPTIKVARVAIEGVETEECPKSLLLLDARADALVQIFIQAETMGGGLGPVESFPGWLYDAVKILKDQASRDENERARAIRSI